VSYFTAFTRFKPFFEPPAIHSHKYTAAKGIIVRFMEQTLFVRQRCQDSSWSPCCQDEFLGPRCFLDQGNSH
jgi:hypothetical protein